MITLESTVSWTNTAKLEAFRKHVLSYTPETINSGWEDIIVPQGAAEIGIYCNDTEMLNWAENWFDAHLEIGIHEKNQMMHRHDQHGIVSGIGLNDYCGNWGFGFAVGTILPAIKKESYQQAVITIADFIIHNAHRTKHDNCITHGGFSENIWVDTLYYAAPPLAHAYAVTGDQSYADAAIEQCLLHAKYLRNDNTGLWHHDANPDTCTRTINLWARGTGWIICALADTLALVPSSTAGYTEALQHYRSLCEAIVRLQNCNGMWRVMPENSDSHLETSGTSMMLNGLLIGIKNNWLEAYVLPLVERGLFEMETWINSRGMLMGSQHPTGRGNWDNLKLTPFGENTYTTGFYMRALAGYEQVKHLRKTVN